MAIRVVGKVTAGFLLLAIAPAMAAIILSDKGRKALLACIAYSATFGPFSILAAASVVDWRHGKSQ